MLRAICKRGIRSLVILAPGAADDGFAAQFARDAEEIDSPGCFTENVFAIAPMILDNTGALGQELAARLLAATAPAGLLRNACGSPSREAEEGQMIRR